LAKTHKSDPNCDSEWVNGSEKKGVLIDKRDLSKYPELVDIFWQRFEELENKSYDNIVNGKELKTFAIVAADIDEDLTAAILPPLLLGCFDASTFFALLTFLPLFNSPNAIATSAESLYILAGRDFINFNNSSFEVF
jgi:hypothetical protein